MTLRNRPEEAAATAALTASLLVGWRTIAVRSTVEPSTTGTLRAIAEMRPLSSGITCARISGELVSAGMMFSPAARELLKAGAGDIGQPLVVGDGVDRREEGPLDAEGVVEDPQDRGDRIGGIGTQGHDVGVRRQNVVVDAAQQNRNLARFLGSRGDHHLSALRRRDGPWPASRVRCLPVASTTRSTPRDLQSASPGALALRKAIERSST